jgi:hypothetical protein
MYVYCNFVRDVMISRVKGGGRAPPHPQQANFPSKPNVRHKAAFLPLCVYSVGQTFCAIMYYVDVLVQIIPS